MKDSSKNLNLVRGELIKQFGHQWRAANELGVRESRLSRILNGHVKPSETERSQLKTVLGADLADKFFGEIDR
jgi:hypothetical protein